MLINIIGEEALEVYNTTENEKDIYKGNLKMMDIYYSPKANVTYIRC